MPDLIIPRVLFNEVLEYCSSVFPHEACGILAGIEGRVARVYPVKNIDSSPVSYFMDPSEQLHIQKQMRERKEEMVAIFHSHPQSPAYPSAKDVRLAFYEDAFYMIVGLSEGITGETRAFTIVEGKVQEITISIVD